MRYNYSYKNEELHILKLIILAIAFLSDLVNITMVISAIFNKDIWLMILIIFIIFLVVRISTVYMTYDLEYSYYKEKLTITKTYYRKKYKCIEINKKDIVLISEKIEKDSKKIYSKPCTYKKYTIYISDERKYELCLSDTLYSALTCEDKYDLFR